jgi:tight adherence protein C
LIIFVILSVTAESASNALLIGLAIAVVPAVLVPIYRQRETNAHRQRLERQVPDALDLLVVCTEAGLSLDSAFQRISKELWMTAAELAHEFSITSAELALLPDRRSAIANLARRTESPSLRVLTSSLIQTERYGTPVARALRVLADEMRDRRMLRAEAKAARLPAVMTIPLIVFILPTLFVVIIGPALLQIYDILSRG